MDLSKLTTSDKVIAGSGLAYLVFMFFSWYGLDGYSGGNSGWDYFLGGILPLILIAVMTAQVLLSRFSPETKLPDPPVPWSRVHLLAGVAAALLVVLRVVIVSEVDTPIGDIELDRKIGVYLAALAAIGAGIGGFLKSQEGEA